MPASLRTELKMMRFDGRLIGLSDGAMLLLVAHVVLQEDESEVIRIIYARKADQKEWKRL
jgi:uncharacterized DUF497 family protein